MDDLNIVIDYIEKINTKNLLPHDIEKIKYYELEYLDNVIEEQEQIAYLMHNSVNNKIPIKLLNIYKVCALIPTRPSKNSARQLPNELRKPPRLQVLN